MTQQAEDQAGLITHYGLGDFDYELPEDLIAQSPLERRDSSRLMAVDRSTGEICHRTFRDIKGYLAEGDVLVLNDTRVIPARIFGRKKTGGKIEFLAVRRSPENPGAWKCLIRSLKGLGPGSRVYFDEGVECAVLGKDPEGYYDCEFNVEDLEEVLERAGAVPLPPYIRRPAGPGDSSRYQTVFAEKSGAVAAPTAGLHFTEELLGEISGRGVEIVKITLHTGPGTFMPVRTADIRDHRMPGEFYSIPGETYSAVMKAKKEKRRVVAVGSTSMRALEAAALGLTGKPALEGYTGLFIYPGFNFKAVDALVTNFHLPGSTLLMLVAAFAGYDLTMRAYKEAIKEHYRFYSYGDAMFVF